MGKGTDGCTWPMPDPLAEGIARLRLPAVYEVGGAVRDRLLGKPPKDRDFMVCGLTPEELLGACQRAGKSDELIVAGQLVGVRLRSEFTPKEGVEIALARTEVSTGPGHGDFRISPLEPDPEIQNLPPEERSGHTSLKDQLIEDLSRRDFTCNAIAQDLESGQLIDPWGGKEDIEAGRLELVSDQAFRDDPLRILRGLGRVSRDGLTPSPKVSRLAKQHAPEISSLSGERVAAEMNKILSGSEAAEALSLARDWGALQSALPELSEMIGFDQQSRYHNLTVDEHTIKAIAQADRMGLDAELKLALLFHDCGKPHTAKPKKDGGMMYHAAEPEDPMWQHDPQRASSHEKVGAEIFRKAARRLGLSGRSTDRVSRLVQGHMFGAEQGFADKPSRRQQLLARRMIARYGLETSRDLVKIRICDLAGKKESPPADFDRHALKLLEVLEGQKLAPTSISDLSLTGGDLIKLGLKPGPQVGKVLDSLLKIVVGEPQENQPERLRGHAQRAIERLS